MADVVREMVAYHTRCRECMGLVIIRAFKEDMNKWESGTCKDLIQDVFPYMKPDEREVMISGTCGKCFDKMFKNLDT